jgi:hypothetical protein
MTAETPSREIPLINGSGIQPFDQSRLAEAFGEMAARSRQERGPLMTRALRDLLHQYDRLRQKDVHRYPQLAGLRVYRLSWVPDPHLGNVDHPNQKTLLAEVDVDSPKVSQ